MRLRAPKKQYKRGKKRAPKRQKYPYKGEQMASKAEVTFAKDMDSKEIPWMYEPERLDWFPPPAKMRKYTPDFKIMHKDGSYFFVEFKGFLRPNDKPKMIAVKKQNPDIDIRFVFMNAHKYIDKRVRKDGSRMTYADWADRYGYKWAEMTIPEDWLNETM